MQVEGIPIGARNVETLYREANVETRAAGRNWYREASRECIRMADDFAVPVTTVCGVVSALSPQTRWWVNLRGAERLLEAYAAGLDGPPAGVTLYNSNAEKAWKIATGQLPLVDAFKPNTKTWAFYHNLRGDLDYITIDTWMLRALGDARKALHPSQYRKAASLIRQEALEFGELPAQFQAIVWLQVQSKGV